MTWCASGLTIQRMYVVFLRQVNCSKRPQQSPSSTLKLECNLKRNTLRILTNDRAPSIISTESNRPTSPSMSIAPVSNKFQSLSFSFDSLTPKVKISLSWLDSQESLMEDVVDGGWDRHWQSPNKLDLVAHQHRLQKIDDGSDSDSVASNADSNQVTKLELKLKIDLVGCDDSGVAVTPHNKQSTYLIIHRCDECWLLRVDKRIGYIANKQFNLHEIYGLSSHTRDNASNDINQSMTDDHIGGECVICLASPRDTVLLPCRHLVACKDCAIRMTDFGGGGVQPDREGGAWGTEGAEPSTSANATEAADAPTQNDRVIAAEAGRSQRRRKRKPKGWYCPICRQPYSAMLRVAFNDQ